MPSNTIAIEKLAASIGENVYIDIAKWHLYLADAHLHLPVAEQLYPMLEDGDVEESQVAGVLQSLSIELGGGKTTLPLASLIPSAVVGDLMRVLEEFRREEM
ncbi:MAG: DUF3181 family protein [Limnospira sp.]